MGEPLYWSDSRHVSVHKSDAWDPYEALRRARQRESGRRVGPCNNGSDKVRRLNCPVQKGISGDADVHLRAVHRRPYTMPHSITPRIQRDDVRALDLEHAGQRSILACRASSERSHASKFNDGARQGNELDQIPLSRVIAPVAISSRQSWPHSHRCQKWLIRQQRCQHPPHGSPRCCPP